MGGRAERQNWIEETDMGASDGSHVRRDGGRVRSRQLGHQKPL